MVTDGVSQCSFSPTQLRTFTSLVTNRMSFEGELRSTLMMVPLIPLLKLGVGTSVVVDRVSSDLCPRVTPCRSDPGRGDTSVRTTRHLSRDSAGDGAEWTSTSWTKSFRRRNRRSRKATTSRTACRRLKRWSRNDWNDSRTASNRSRRKTDVLSVVGLITFLFPLP